MIFFFGCIKGFKKSGSTLLMATKSQTKMKCMYIYIHTINITEGSLKMRLDSSFSLIHFHFFFTDHYTCKNPDQSFRFASLIFNLFEQLCFWGFFFFRNNLKKKLIG